MKKLLFPISLIIFFTCVLSINLYAQMDNKSNPNELMAQDFHVLFGDLNKDQALIESLLLNSPKSINAPGLPRFAIIGRDRKFYLGIGGYVKGTLSYDLGNPIESPFFFTTSAIPMNQKAGNGALVQFSAATSNIFFNFIGLPHTKNQIGAYINFNFTANNSYGLSLQNAYLTYRNFLVGYNLSLFTDGNACIPLIDFEGPNAFAITHNSVINWIYNFKEHWTVGAGIEMPMLSATYNSYTYGINQRIPDIPAYIQYNWKKGAGWIRLSGILRFLYYRDNFNNDNNCNIGGGIKLSGSVPINHKLTAYYQGIYGSGINNYIQDMTGLGMDMVPTVGKNNSNITFDESELGKLKNTSAVAAYAGLSYQLCPRISVNALYSFVRSYLPDTELVTSSQISFKENNMFMPGTTYKSAQYVVANMFFSITPTVTTGIEYLWGNRKDVNGVFKQDTRIQTAIRVNF